VKLRRVRIENVRSFLDPAELLLDGDVSIIIGPNGGGKTNLLDTVTTVLRRHLLTSWLPVRSPTVDQPDRYEFRANDAFNTNTLEPHSQGAGKPQRVEVELEVSSIDIDNIVAMRDSAIELAELAGLRYIGVSLAEAKDWDPSILSAGQRHTYRITNNVLEEVTDLAAKLYQRYLALYEADNRLRSELGKAPLSMPMVSMPVDRAGGTFQASLSLASHNENDFKRGVDSASSRSSGSIITMAVGRIASRYRILLEKDSGTARKEFYADPQISALSKILTSLGYSWSLECTNALANQYDVRLDKQGSSFLVKAASSGEKELLTYLFAIYALNVRDALIVIDEPELHLHPRWQTILLALFERLTLETGNQFLLATHSPVFVSPASIQYVSRVYAKEQKSNIVRIKSDHLPQAKHLFAIVNSQNNERMFFADKVVLVEGISDRLFLDAVFRHLGVYDRSVQTCEIISVGGKGFFSAYEKVLQACQVPYAIVADLDFLNEIGPPELKKLFEVNEKAIVTDVILNPTSSDGDSLVTRMEAALASGNAEELKALWSYIKGRRRRLRSDLKDEERKQLDAFIASKRGERLFILSRGSLEAYLPLGYASKDLDKLITLITGDFWPLIPDEVKGELSAIADAVVAQST
jgi:ABC-type lipoprotein export system ATPase subunit